MASLPKLVPKWIPLTAEELLALRGTPEFDKELSRQMQVIADHDRKNHHADYLEPDWASLDKTWK